jgi:hypothetical protein
MQSSKKKDHSFLNGENYESGEKSRGEERGMYVSKYVCMYLDRVIASKVQANVLKKTTVTSTEYKAISVEPIWVLRIVLHGMTPQHITHFS